MLTPMTGQVFGGQINALRDGFSGDRFRIKTPAK
jgi:hypothetical protein